MLIRQAVEADMEQITEIYNVVLGTSTAIYSDIPATVAERILWFETRLDSGYPLLVATDGDTVHGFATFGDFRSSPGYRFTVEGTIHLRPGSRGNGFGSQLLAMLLESAWLSGKHVMVAAVDSGNIASLRFLEKSGFERVGHLREVGFKFNRFLDLVLLQRLLTPPNFNSAP